MLHYAPATIPVLSELRFVPFRQLHHPHILPPSLNLDLLWQTGWFFRGSGDPRPSWSGFMQDVSIGDHTAAADIRMLPIIDLNPGDRSYILSTLSFVCDQAAKLQIDTPCITFDQPLWIKAVEIARAQNLKIVCRLGTFHMIMSYLGSIGMLMAGSGISEASECCYGPNAVIQMLSGKAVARAVRGHFLVESALTTVLLKSVLDSTEPPITGALTQDEIIELRSVYDRVTSQELTISEGQYPDCMFKLDHLLSNYKNYLGSQSKTARLWLLYLEYISILKIIIRAERTSDWNLHLVGVSKMLNLFAATGHSNYAKCARLYLQMMLRLHIDHPWLHQQFVSGCHAVRRSDRSWAGLSTDLAIEQVMMRAVKSNGGLTHG